MLASPAAPSNPFFAHGPGRRGTVALVVLADGRDRHRVAGAHLRRLLPHASGHALGYFPRVTVTHTSKEAEGRSTSRRSTGASPSRASRWSWGSRSPSRLAAAYGIAVTGTMVITSLIYFEVTRCTWRWSLWKSRAAPGALSVVRRALLRRQPVQVRRRRICPGPRRRRAHVRDDHLEPRATISTASARRHCPSVRRLPGGLPAKLAARIPGAGIFLTGRLTGVPLSLVHYVVVSTSLPEAVVLLDDSIVNTCHTRPRTRCASNRSGPASSG